MDVSDESDGLKVRLKRLLETDKRVALGAGGVSSIIRQSENSTLCETSVERSGEKRFAKLFHAPLPADRRAQFFHELKIARSFGNSHIVKILGSGEWNGFPFVEMEKVEGVSLDEVIKARGALPPDIAMAIMIMICRACVYAHQFDSRTGESRYEGLVHGNLKGANVLIAREGAVKVTGFGTSCLRRDAKLTNASPVSLLECAAPEQLRGFVADFRTDIYAIGLIGYEMIRGKKAFSPADTAALFPARIKNRFPKINGILDRVPLRLCRIIHRCMNSYPEKRFAKMEEVLQDLEKLFGEITAYPPEEMVEYFVYTTEGFAKTPRNLKRVLSVGVTSLAIIAGSIALIATHRTYQEDEPDTDAVAAAQPPAPPPPVHRDTLLSASPDSAMIDSLVQTVAAVDTGTVYVAPRKTPPGHKDEKRKKSKSRTKGREDDAPANAGSDGDSPVVNRDSPPPDSQPEGRPKESQQTVDRSDLLQSMYAAIQSNDFDEALRLYDQLPGQIQATSRARLWKLRALEGSGDKTGLSRFFQGPPVNDKEFFFAKGFFRYEQNIFSDAITSFQSALKTSASMADGENLDGSSLYYIAQSYTQLFEIAHTPESKKIALSSWFEVKFRFRAKQDHQYYKRADEEIRRICAYSGGK